MTGWIIAGLLAVIAWIGYVITGQLDRIARQMEHQGRSLQATIDEASEVGKDNWHRLFKALLESGIIKSATEIKRLNENRDWAEFTAWADAEKKKTDAS